MEITSFKPTHLFILFTLVIFFQATARKSSNIYKSSISDIDLVFSKDATSSEKNSAVRKAIKGSSAWVDKFLSQSNNTLKGAFNFNQTVNLIGIGYSTSSTEARRVADKRCLKALKDEGIEQVGIYPKYLKINTRNGYVIYAILRTPVIGGFKNRDFKSNDDEIEDLFK